MLRHYAVKYLDSNGYTKSLGYIETLREFKPGDIVEHQGRKIKIDFEDPKLSGAVASDYMIEII